MNRETFDKLVENYDSKDEILVSKIALLIEKYPYFQLPRFLYTKSLKDQNKNDLDLALNQLALYTADRGVLKQCIESKFEPSKKIEDAESSEIKPEITSETKKETKPKKTVQKKEKPKVKKRQKEVNLSAFQNAAQVSLSEKGVNKLEPQPKKSVVVSKDLKLSFLDWIQYTEENQNIESLESEKIEPLSDKLPIINRFIKANPKIPPVEKNETIDSVLNQEFISEELMTETLAKVLVKQKKYKKAISAYKILSLKYPEKNVFFAGQIQKIRKLQQQ